MKDNSGGQATARIADWSKKSRVYTLDHTTGVFSSTSSTRGDSEVDGFFKKSSGVTLCCYKAAGTNWLRAGSTLVAMDDSNLSIKVAMRWPIVTLQVMYRDLLVSLKEFAPLSLLAMRIDPAYDSMDFGSDLFAGYMMQKRAQSMKNPGKAGAP